MKHNILLGFFAAIALIATLIGVAALWSSLGIHMTLHGWIAYGLGVVFSIALATGLFYLTFKSAREGYDDIDRAEEFTD